MARKADSFPEKFLERKKREFREFTISMYGIARFGAFTDTVVCAGLYFASIVEGKPFVSEASLYPYLIILIVYELFSIIRRIMDISCEFSSEKRGCAGERRASRRSWGTLLSKVWPFRGLNKLIIATWGFLVVMQQTVYAYETYQNGAGNAFIPAHFSTAVIGVFLICGIGLLSNAVFVIKMPGFKNFLGSLASLAIQRKGLLHRPFEEALERIMWQWRKERKPLDEKKCGECVNGLSHEIMGQFRELGDEDIERLTNFLQVLREKR